MRIISDRYLNEISRQLDRIESNTNHSVHQGAQIMSDLTAAVAELKAEFVVLADEMDANFKALQDALAAGDPAAIAAATADIQAVVKGMKDVAARDAMPPVPAP